MKTIELKKIFKLVNEDFGGEASGMIVSDMLSVVMRDGEENNILVTVQNNVNSIAVASLIHLSCVIICAGFKATDEMIEKATSKEIVVFETELSAVDTIYELKKLGV